MKSKSVCIFVHCFPPAKGGLEYLVEEVKKILDKKYTVHIITGKGSTLDSYKTFKNFLPQNITDKQNNIHRLDLNFFWQRLANKLLNKVILKIGYFSPFYFGPILKYTPQITDIIKNSDIIIGTGMPTKMFYDSYLFAKKYHKKLILMPAYHNVAYYNHCPFFQNTLNYATKILYLTPLERKHLTNNYKIIKNKLIQTTFCPYTKKQIQTQKANLNKIINKKLKRIKNKQINIGFIGQITPRKNLIVFKNYLDKYLSYWQSRGYALKIYLSGAKTNSSPLIENLFKKYINQKIVHTTYDFTDKQQEYKKFDIFINPSIEESLGIVNFEAIYYGLPTIVHPKSVFFEIIKPYLITTKTSYNIEGELNKLINNPKYSFQTSQKQFKILNNFNLDNFQSQLYKIFK